MCDKIATLLVDFQAWNNRTCINWASPKLEEGERERGQESIKKVMHSIISCCFSQQLMHTCMYCFYNSYELLVQSCVQLVIMRSCTSVFVRDSCVTECTCMGDHEVWFTVGGGGEGGHVQIPWQFHCVGNTIISLRSALYQYQIQSLIAWEQKIIIFCGCMYVL